MPFLVTIEVKTMFKYKVITNILPTRATLHPDGLVEKRYMWQRNTEEQTLHYIVTSCVNTAGFFLSKIGGTTEQAKTNLPTSHILYGWHGRTKAWRMTKLLFTNRQILHFLRMPPRGRTEFSKRTFSYLRTKLKFLKRSWLQVNHYMIITALVIQ